MNPSPDGAATSDDVSSRMGIELRTIGIPPRSAILDRIDAESPSAAPTSMTSPTWLVVHDRD